jgi:transposase
LPDLVALLEENKKFKQQLKIAEMEKNFKKAATDVSCFFSTPQ